MHNTLNSAGLTGLKIPQNGWGILYVVAAVVIVTAFALFLRQFKKRKPKKISDANLTESPQSFDNWPEENYKSVTERIKQVGNKYKSILFASVEPGALPVTIPVNVAITLAKNKKRCLLVDLDLKRNAVAEVFEINTTQNSFSPKAVQTEFDNLWIWPAHNFTSSKQMNIKAIVQNAQEKFDFILINAPSLVSSPDRRQIVSAARAAFICTKNASEVSKLTELTKPSNCMVIGHIQIPS